MTTLKVHSIHDEATLISLPSYIPSEGDELGGNCLLNDNLNNKKAQTHAYRHIQTLSWCVIHITIYYIDSLRHLIKHKTRLEHQMNIREIVLVMKYRKNNHTCTSTLLIIISHNDGRQKVIVWKSDSWWNETEWCVNLDYFTLKKWRFFFFLPSLSFFVQRVQHYH